MIVDVIVIVTVISGSNSCSRRYRNDDKPANNTILNMTTMATMKSLITYRQHFKHMIKI